MNEFFKRIRKAQKHNNSCLCIGLDPDIERIPGLPDESSELISDFLTKIIDATANFVCAYKPNIAFFEAEGIKGISQLKKIISHIRSLPIDIPIILDVKRGDIANTARAYARAAFDYLEADAITANPYMGGDTMMPFIEREERGVFLLCLTSNPGYTDFQSLDVENEQLFERVAEKAAEWNIHDNIGLIVGATHPDEAKKIRKIAPELPFLMPGVGTQGADPSLIMKIGTTSDGFLPIVNSSRSILYASGDKNFAAAAGETAEKTKNKLNMYLTR